MAGNGKQSYLSERRDGTAEIKNSAGQSCLEYIIIVLLLFMIVLAFLTLSPQGITYFAAILWIITVACGCLSGWSAYHIELKAEGLASGKCGKKVKYAASVAALAVVMGFSLHFLADFFLMANSFTEMKLANLVTQSPPWAVEKPEIYADDARIELWIRFPQGAFQLIALGGKTWKNLLQQIPPGFEKYLPLLSWQQVRAPDPSGRQVDYQSIPFGNPMEKETNRLSYFGEALFQMPLQVKTLRVFQRDTKGAFFVSEEITEFIIP